MPTIAVEKNNGKPVLIVGDGASNKRMDWKHVQRRISQIHGRTACPVVLLNGMANGRRPAFAVGDTPTVLKQYQESDLYKRCHVIMNAPHKVAGQDEIKRSLGALVLSARTWFAPDKRQPLPAGPLAVWAMTAMGYASIYLFGFDGSLGSGSTAEHIHSRLREGMIRRHMTPRINSVFGREATADRPKLLRVWPLQVIVKGTDPLEGVLADTIRLEPAS